MDARFLRSLTGVLLALSLSACAETPLEYPDGAVALTGVSVAWMGDDSVLPDRRVIVLDGLIVDVLGPEAPPLSDDVTVIAQGGYVMPGLTDLHVHANFATDLPLFVANGVTTVRNLFGSPQTLQWRAEIAAGERLGPTLITAGPIVDGDPPFWPGSALATNEAEGRAAVQAQVEAGYDLIKVYSALPREAWAGAVSEAASLGIQAVGHVPTSVTYSDVVESSQATIEHLDGLSDELAGFAWWEPMTEAEVQAAVAAVDPAAVDNLAARLAATRTWNVPTQVVFANNRLTAEQMQERRAAPEMAYAHPQYLSSWQNNPPLDPNDAAAWAAVRTAWRDWLGALHRGGAPIGLGTDCANPWVVAGFSVHDELALLVDAGLTPYEALRAGTAGAAEAVGRSDFGVVEAGRRADLVWLDEDPLSDVSAAKTPRAVMLGGQWLDRDALDEELAEIAESFAR